eukprot:scaffold6485_cov116-Skeletonema_dohrnii-CCMP3373.AAC.9
MNNKDLYSSNDSNPFRSWMREGTDLKEGSSSFVPARQATISMHPPLDRPHPECVEEIDDLYHCHATTSKLKFWGCNNVKFALDQCLKKEKQNLLVELNKDAAEKRAAEEDAYQKALGKEMSFEDYLKKDKDFNKAMEDRRRMEESKQKK